MSTATQARLSVAVCTWNRAALLADCLESLVGQEVSGGFEVLVVDDGSTDDTAATVARIADSAPVPVRHLRQEHKGLNAARNRAVAEASGLVVHFLDDDELAPPGLLARVLARLDEDPGLDGVGGPCRDHGSGPGTCAQCSLAAVDVPGEGVREVPRLLGGNMALKRELFRTVGPFHQHLSGRGDENEWFHRAAGRRFLQDPDLWLWHRRDHLSLLGVWRTSFRQGRAMPEAFALQGKRYRFRPWAIVRYLAHAALRRCARGWWLAARDLGALAGALERHPGGCAYEGTRQP